MKTAISARIDDLIAAAQRLQMLIDREDPAMPLPAVPLFKLAADVDQAVLKLEAHLQKLTGNAPADEPPAASAGLPAWNNPTP
jgi:hypothetical protein